MEPENKESWLKLFRDVVLEYNKKRAPDPFMSWFREKDARGFFDEEDKVLVVLIDARFDQMTTAENALENTKTVVQAGCLKETIDANSLPQLIPRQYFTAEGWTELFLQALPKLRVITKRIVARNDWKANELRNLMLSEIKAPYFGVKTVRLAIRWLYELLPNYNIDMDSYEIPIDRLVYRVSCRLGLLNPNVDKYWGQGSDADVKLQNLLRQLMPGKQWIFDEPLWSTGRKAVNGGHCFPIKPNCSGCIFDNICKKKYVDFAPESVGMEQKKQSHKQFGLVNVCEEKDKPSDQQLAFAKFINELHQKGIKGEEFRDKRAQWFREHKDQ